MFQPLRYDRGKLRTLKASSGLSVSKGDALVFSSGYAAAASSSDTEVRFIAMEDVSSATEGDEFLAIYTPGVEFLVDTEDNMAQSYIDNYCDVGDDDGELDPDSTSNNVFYIIEMVGTPSTKQCKGFFVEKTS